MRTTLLACGLMLAFAVAPAGCKKEKKKADDKTAEPTKPETPETPPKPEGGGGGEGGGEGGGGQTMTNKMMHCPSAAPGAETKVEQTKDAVVVSITTKDAAGAKEIQERAKHMASLTAGGAPKVEHTGKGTGGGALGKCPIMMADVTLKTEDIKDGVKVTLTPKDPAKLAEVAKTAQDRAASMPADMAGGAGDKPAGEDDTPADEP